MARRYPEPVTIADLDAEDRSHREDEARNDAEVAAVILMTPEAWADLERYDVARPMPEPRPDEETER